MSEPAGTTDSVEATDHAAPAPKWRRTAGLVVYLVVGVVLALIILGLGRFAIRLIVYLSMGDTYALYRLDSDYPWFATALTLALFAGSCVIARYLMKRHGRKIAWVLGPVIVLLCIAWSGWSGYGYWQFAVELERWRTVAGEHGRKSLEDPFYYNPIRGPFVDNAAMIYNAAATAAPQDPPVRFEDGQFVEYRDAPVLGGAPGEVAWQGFALTTDELRDRLVPFEPSFEALERASRVPRCINLGFTALDTFHWSVHAAATLARIDHRHDDVMHYSLLRFRMAHHEYESGQSWYSEGDVAIAERETITLLTKAPLDVRPARWTELIEQLRKIKPWAQLRRSLIHDAAYSIQSRRVGETEDWILDRAARFGLLGLDKAEFTRRAALLIEHTDPDVYRENGTPVFAHPAPWWLFQRKRYGVDEAAEIKAVAAHDQLIRMAECYALIARHHATHGSFPPSLDTIDNAPIDPESEKPFVYTRRNDGFTLAPPGPIADPNAVWRW